MKNSAIVGAPNLLFLGAGASRPYGKLLMGEFIDLFKRKIAGGNNHPFAIPLNSSPLLNAICAEHEDLEFLIEELDALGSRDYLEKQSVDRNFPGTGGVQESRWPEFQQIATEARKLLAKLKQEVYLQYRKIPDPAQTVILTKPIRLLGNDSHIVVFTTNYDPAVEKFCAMQNLRLMDGFVHDERTQEYVWSRAAFSEPLGVVRSLVLFKLHGSANWHRHDGRIIRGLPTYDIGDPDYQNVMIYPATRKVATEDPFFTAYDYLEQCLDEADSCLVIGYSFRDYDTLMRFKSATLSNRHLRISVLDPNADTICKYLKEHGISAYPIAHAFGDKEAEYLPLITSGIVGETR